MGADMIAATIWLAQGTEPDWEKAETTLAGFTCPAGGFPEDHDLSDTIVEDMILGEYEDKEASTDKQRKEIVDGILKGAYQVVKDGVEGKRRDMTFSVFAGWVVYISGGLSWGDAPTDAEEAIRNLSGTGILEAAGFNTRPEKVMAVVLESKYDTTVTLARDEKEAEKVVAAFCREFWEKVTDTDLYPEPPASDHETIERFFASDSSGNWWEKRTWVSTENLAI